LNTDTICVRVLLGCLNGYSLLSKLGESFMVTTTQIVVTEPLRYGWTRETEQSYIELKVDEENTLRLAFNDRLYFQIKLCLQTMQGHVNEERRKAALLVIEDTILTPIKNLEYGRDDINQIAMIRTYYQKGGSLDMHIQKSHLKETIEFLQGALQAFEKLSKSQTH